MFDQEPTPVDNPLTKLRHDRVGAHGGGYRGVDGRMAIVTAENILSVLDGKPNKDNAVNKEVFG